MNSFKEPALTFGRLAMNGHLLLFVLLFVCIEVRLSTGVLLHPTRSPIKHSPEEYARGLLRDLETQGAGMYFSHATEPADDARRFHAVYDKLVSGLPIVVAGVGGSITAGNRIAKNQTYGHMLVMYLQKHFPSNSPHTYIQVGCPARDSSYLHVCFLPEFNSRSGNVSMSDVDLWLLDTAANDIVLLNSDDRSNKEAWVHVEAVVRAIFSRSPRSSIVFIWFAAGYDNRWSNTQEYQRTIANHYSIPAISWLTFMQVSGGYRGKRKQLLLADGRTHPTALGHKLASNLLQHVLLSMFIQTSLTTPRVVDLEPTLPGGFLDDPEPLCIRLLPTYVNWNLDVTQGFTFGGMKPGRIEGLLSRTPGSLVKLSFNTTTHRRRISLGVARTWQCTRHAPPFCPGKAKVSLDGEPGIQYNGRIIQKYSVVGPLTLGEVNSGLHTLKVNTIGRSGHVLISGVFGFRV